MIEEKPFLCLDAAGMDYVLRRVRETTRLVFDVETSGLNPRKCHIVGYVLTVGPRPEDTMYVPVRHQRGGNCLDWKGLAEAEDERIMLHPFEIELAKAVNRPGLTVIGHNLVFDLLFSAHKGIFFGGSTECTQVAMALINEHLPSYSLDGCARYMKVTEKKGDALYFHMAREFGGEPDRKQMANFWKLAGNDPIAVDYACGDGVSTWELRIAQDVEIAKQELDRVWTVERRVTKTLFRMQYGGMPVSVERLEQVKLQMESMTEEARKELPAGLNVRSGPQMKAAFDLAGIGGYPKTDKGNPSFTEEWLETNDLGLRVLRVRKFSNLLNTFIMPLMETHLHQGRLHPSYAQLASDDFGTVTGRLSSYAPNIQQVPKRNKELGKIFRSVFVPDDGMTWASNDYSQCLAANTKVMVPGGTKNIVDLRAGDMVYSYTDDKKPVLRKVMWSGKTGMRKLCRLHWMTNSRTNGYLDATDDHKIRLHDGSYATVGELLMRKGSKKSKYSCGVWVWAMRNGNPGNHFITYIEELSGTHPVYDITVQETHNFIANEICVHNCEPRIYAHYSGSELLINNYKATPVIDFYQTLANITGLPRSPTAGITGNCKQLALSIFYGAGVPKTAILLGVSESEARKIRAMIQQMCPEIGDFAKDAKYRAMDRGWVKTVLGRRARFTDERGAYKAAGRVVQGGNADIIKLALVEVDDYLQSEACPPPIATVHDAIECQFPTGRNDINDEVVRIMEHCGQCDMINFSVPQVVDNGTGEDYAEATYG